MPVITGADKVALGGAEADRVYLGNALIWEPTVPAGTLPDIFSGRTGGVWLFGTGHTECYVETTGEPPVTICGHGDPVGTIHDKVTGTWFRMSSDPARRPNYQIVNGRHFLQFDGNTRYASLGTIGTTIGVDMLLATDIDGDTTGMFVGSNAYQDFDNYFGVYQAGSGSNNILSSETDPAATVVLRVDGQDVAASRGDFHAALATGPVVAHVRGNGSWSFAAQTGLYNTVEPANFSEYHTSQKLYGLIWRQDAALTQAERTAIEAALAAQLPSADPLAALYGTGLGEIPLHLTPEDAVLDGNGGVTAVPNRGGAGAHFNTTANTTAIDIVDGYFSVPPGFNFLTLDNVADLKGARLFFVAKAVIKETLTLPRFAGHDIPATWIRADYSGNSIHLSHPSGAASLITSGAITQALRLYEIEVTDKARLWVDGLSQSEHAAAANWSSFPISRLLAGYGGQSFEGEVGDILSVITDGSASYAPVMLTVRQALAAKHGITLA